MTFRAYIVDAATQVCEFNRKLTFGRLGPHALTTHSTTTDIRNQDVLVREEKLEFDNAQSVVEMLDGAIDLLVTEVWLDVLGYALHDSPKCYTIEMAIERVLERYTKYPLTDCYYVEPLLMLARLGVDVQGATQAVLNDNNTKFVTGVADCAATVEHYKTKVNVKCEARPVDHYQREWGVFRLPDLKLLKPKSYLDNKLQGGGLNLLGFLPEHLRSAPAIPLAQVEGDSPIHTWANRSTK